ncbi:MAG: tryptophan synthase subunit alpha [Nitrospirae bacterium]|nr:MAG: tryptophan synthase subunit alpha [Nitrospirota bacterium]
MAPPVPNRIASTFDQLQCRGEKALIPYIMAGDPSLAETEALVATLEQAGADLIELGVPFSDPIADGPTIQKAAERALRAGTSLRRILALVHTLRAKVAIPLILMAYYNTLMAMGEENFCREAVAAGVDGVIIPDMPPEEAEPLWTAAEATGLCVIFLLAPTSTPARRREVIRRTRGFIYYVSLTGITGAKLTDMDHVQTSVTRLKKVAKKPVAVGFGVATPADVHRIAQFADGAIVGSALVRLIEEHHNTPHFLTTIEQFTRQLKAATCSTNQQT